MARFKTLAAVLHDAEGRPLKAAEELALVIGLAAHQVKGEMDSRHDQAHQLNQRVGMGGVVAAIVLAGLAIWWAQSQGRGTLVPAIVVATLVALVLFGTLFFVRWRQSRERARKELAAVTRLGRFYWPVGLLPLSDKQAVLWDPQSEATEPLAVLTAPLYFGEESVNDLQATERLHDAFDVMLRFDEGLAAMGPSPTPWPGNVPDGSAQRLGEELPDLWERLVPAPADVLDVAVPPPADWDELSSGGDQLHHFHQQLPQTRATLDQYQARAEALHESARELLIERHWRVRSQVDEERNRLFASAPAPETQAEPLPLTPGSPLVAAPAASAAQLSASLAAMQQALQPLDQDVAATLDRFASEEARERAEAEHAFAERRRALDDEQRRLATLDSEILQLGSRLDDQQQRIHEYATRTQEGFRAIEGVPLRAVQEALGALQGRIEQAITAIADVAGKIELEAIEATVAETGIATAQAHEAWRQLSAEMPQRSADVQSRTERILTELSQLNGSPGGATPSTLAELESAAREVERVARTVVSWAAAQEDPIDPVEDRTSELSDHLAALRAQRRTLEGASAILSELSEAESSHPLTLPTAITRAEETLATFIRLSEKSADTVNAMDNAAAAVKMQADQLARLLRERDEVRRRYEATLSTLQADETQRYEAIAGRWQGERTQLHAQRTALGRLEAAIQSRLAQPRPALDGMGALRDGAAVDWPDRVVNDLGYSLDLWAQRVAGVEAPTEQPNRVQTVRDTLERQVQALEARATPVALPSDGEPLEPTLCFVPFWLVESAMQPEGETQPGLRYHLFPPARLAPRKPTDAPTVASLLYPELSRRLAAHLRAGIGEEALPLEALHMTPEQLTDAGRALDLAAAQSPLSEMATALAQHWVFFRTPDSRLNQILQNSRNHLIPEAQILAAWTQSIQQGAALPDSQRQLAEPETPNES